MKSPREKLEVRLTALLMGELSEKEAAALQTQMDSDPALAALYARLRRASELLREAVSLPEETPLRLSDERRARLLAHFKAPAKPPVILRPRWKSAAPLALAASIAVLLGGGLFWINDYGWQQKGRMSGMAAPEMESREGDSTYRAVNDFIAQAPPAPPSTRWASQPGAIRTYSGRLANDFTAQSGVVGSDGAKADEFQNRGTARNLVLGQIRETADALAPAAGPSARFFAGGGSGTPAPSMPSASTASGVAAGNNIALADGSEPYAISDPFSVAGKADMESKITAFDTSGVEAKPSESTRASRNPISGRMGGALKRDQLAANTTALASSPATPMPAAPATAAHAPVLAPAPKAASDSSVRGFGRIAETDGKRGELAQAAELPGIQKSLSAGVEKDVALRQVVPSQSLNFGAGISSETMTALSEQNAVHTKASGAASLSTLTPAFGEQEAREKVANLEYARRVDTFAKGGEGTLNGGFGGGGAGFGFSAPAPQRPSGGRDDQAEAAKGLKETNASEAVPTSESKWLYVHKDGAIGGEKKATEENPIVGRTAFWVEDESSKLNIDTASEGKFWDEPAPVEFEGFINYGSPITPPGKQDAKAEIQGLLSDADGLLQSSRYDLAYKKSEQVLAIDPYNIAARKLEEKVNEARDNFADSAYNEARSRATWRVNNAWENPVRKFESKSEAAPSQPTTADGGRARLEQEGLKPADSNQLDLFGTSTGIAPAQEQLQQESTVSALKEKLAKAQKNLEEPSFLRATQDGETASTNLGIAFTGTPGNRPVQPNSEPLVRQKVASGGAGGSAEKVQGRALEDKGSVDSISQQNAPKEAKRTEIALGRKQAADNAHDRYFRESELADEKGKASEPAATGKPPSDSRPSLASDKKPEVAGATRGLTPEMQAPAKPAAASKPQPVEDKLDVKKSSDDPALAPATPAKPADVPQPEVLTSANAFSTFSLNVSDVAFKLAGASLEQGKMPEPSTVRSEEFINAFDYRDPEPAPGAPLAFASERARYPFAQNRDLLRLSVKTAAAGRQPGRPLNLVLLLDNSGSMERADRVRILHEALGVLAKQLQPQDRLSIITFARTPRLWADGVAGNQASEVVARVGEITPQGGTNLAAALDLGYETAKRYYQVGSINRVVLLTDGAANLGDVDPAALKQKVEAHRKQGVALDCFGIGWEGYNDDLLEQLSRNGDGRYGFINTPEQAASEFAAQLAGALRVAASDVKVQVEFNPRRVSSYRQVGYAKHQLTKQQFRDNTVDAAEIGAAESGNALYVVEVNPRGEGDLATVRVRFKVPGTSDYKEHEWTVPFTCAAPPFEQAAPSLRLAGSASAFSEMLAGSPFAAEVTSDRLLGYLNGIPTTSDPRPPRLEWMIRQAKSISGR